MTCSRHPRFRAAVTALALLAAGSAWAGPTQKDIASEISMATAAATAVVSDLQHGINGATLAPNDLSAAVIKAGLRAHFQKLGGGPFDAAPDPERAEIRAVVESSLGRVIDKYRSDMLRGGQDAFVPAFFRAQLLELVNQQAQGKFRALATNRTSDLINRDSGAERLVSDKAVLGYVQELLEKGLLEPQFRQFEGKLVSYWPMKLSEPCVACHQRSGLEQTVGQFGGATLIVVEAGK